MLGIPYNSFFLCAPEPGTIQFEKRGILVKESCGEAEVSVVRQNGADGEISIKYRTIDGTATESKDFIGGEGVVHFKHGETHQFIKIAIIDDYQFERDENFEIELFEPEGGAKLGKIDRTVVTITNDDLVYCWVRLTIWKLIFQSV